MAFRNLLCILKDFATSLQNCFFPALFIVVLSQIGAYQVAIAQNSCADLFEDELDSASDTIPGAFWLDEQAVVIVGQKPARRWTSLFIREFFPLFNVEQVFAKWMNHRPNLNLTPADRISIHSLSTEKAVVHFPNYDLNSKFGISSKVDLSRVENGDLVQFSRRGVTGKVIELQNRPYRKLKILKDSGEIVFVSFDPEDMAIKAWVFEARVTKPNGYMHFINIYDGVSAESATRFPMVERIRKLLQLIPHDFVSAIETIELNPSSNKDDQYWSVRFGIPFFKSAASAGRGSDNMDRMTFYHNRYGFSRSSFNLTQTFLHEFGHLFAILKFGTPTPPSEWLTAMYRDNTKITSYAKFSSAEDFAETIAYYLIMGNSPFLRKAFKHRFELLDKYFNANHIRSKVAK